MFSEPLLSLWLLQKANFPWNNLSSIPEALVYLESPIINYAKKIDKRRDRDTDRQTDRQTDIHTYRQTDRHTDRHTDRLTD